ncbi:MAG TPA: hypothetical protein VIZ28_18205, partial [Chitinophagaceae bacterium]
FIQQYLQEGYLHGGIGGTDAERILLEKGFEPVFFPYHHEFSLKARISRFLFLVKTVFSIKKGSVIIFLFPVYARMNKLLLQWLKKRNNRIICVIADINGLKDGDDKMLKEEIRFFRQFRYFIVHNDKMRSWVYDHISKDCRIATIEFFDFLTKPVSRLQDISFDIVFAGNLEKSSFLKGLQLLQPGNPSLHFHLYGAGQGNAVYAQPNITWHGIEKPYELPAKLEGSFGLVWDGDSIDKPGGSLGEYMQYISHHKLSLYIISGLPLIVPATAASAPLVEKYKIGFSVNSLFEIEGKIKNLSPAEYRQMQVNMQPLAEKISKGECLGEAIDDILK